MSDNNIDRSHPVEVERGVIDFKSQRTLKLLEFEQSCSVHNPSQGLERSFRTIRVLFTDSFQRFDMHVTEAVLTIGYV